MLALYLLLMTFLTNWIQVLQHWWKKCVDTRYTVLKNKPHLVTFNVSVLVSLWTFQLTLISIYLCQSLHIYLCLSLHIYLLISSRLSIFTNGKHRSSIEISNILTLLPSNPLIVKLTRSLNNNDISSHFPFHHLLINVIPKVVCFMHCHQFPQNHFHWLKLSLLNLWIVKSCVPYSLVSEDIWDWSVNYRTVSENQELQYNQS